MKTKEINIGDYVRAEIEGLSIQRICKIIKIISDDFFYTDIGYFDKENIIKSSSNIIDLIEENDYVNGEKVICVGYPMYKETKNGLKGIDDKIVIVGIYNKWGIDKKTLKEKDIKSIVTREQFESMKYEVK